MGYPVQNGAPTVTVQGRTFAIGAFDWVNPVGNFYKVGVYERMPDGSWNEVQAVATYTNDGDLLADIQKRGGGVAYIKVIVAAVNAFFAKLFGAAPPAPTGEPQTDAQAKAFVAANVNGLKITVVNGVPVVS